MRDALGFHSRYPVARYQDLVITETGDELLVYDETSHQIHHLNAEAASVWRLCDGVRSIDAIARDSGMSGRTGAFLASVQSLARVRKLIAPIQLNLAEQQVSVAGNSRGKGGRDDGSP